MAAVTFDRGADFFVCIWVNGNREIDSP